MDSPQAPVLAAAFSPDGKFVATGHGFFNSAKLWDAETGERLRSFRGHTADVTSVAFSQDSKQLLTSAADNTTRLWDFDTRKELCRLVAFDDGTWAVIDLAGRYDAANGGDVEGLHWVIKNEPIALSQLKERYYDPGLLAKYLGFNKEPLREVAAFSDVKMYPGVMIAQADPKKPRMNVTLSNQGGGIGRVVIFVNGKELTGDARPRGANANASSLDLQLDLSSDPRLVPGRKNTVEVMAYNADGFLASRGLVREFDAPGEVVTTPPSLHAVIVGVSKYRGDKLNLRFASKDAEDFAAALRLAASRLFTYARQDRHSHCSRPIRSGRIGPIFVKGGIEACSSRRSQAT